MKRDSWEVEAAFDLLQRVYLTAYGTDMAMSAQTDVLKEIGRFLRYLERARSLDDSLALVDEAKRVYGVPFGRRDPDWSWGRGHYEEVSKRIRESPPD